MPNPVDQPERTAHYDCVMCIVEMNTIAQTTETVLLIFPFLQTNITVQMRPSGGLGYSSSSSSSLEDASIVKMPCSERVHSKSEGWPDTNN